MKAYFGWHIALSMALISGEKGLSSGSKYDSAAFAKAQAVAHSRLYPSIFAANYLVCSNRRVRMENFFRTCGRIGRVLDVGAQYCPYYPLFQDKCDSYSSMDIVDTPLVDIVCNAEDMPVEDCSFDMALCTQVLEHCNNPQGIMDECYRVLKPGGVLIVTVPSIYPLHGYPADNWRFMPDGMRYLLRSFSTVDVQAEVDFPESLANVVCRYGHVVTGRLGMVGQVVNPLWNCATNLCGKALSLALRPLTRSNFTSFTMNLWCLARK
jgi:SAM-dependent methyltransferase